MCHLLVEPKKNRLSSSLNYSYINNGFYDEIYDNLYNFMLEIHTHQSFPCFLFEAVKNYSTFWPQDKTYMCTFTEVQSHETNVRLELTTCKNLSLCSLCHIMPTLYPVKIARVSHGWGVLAHMKGLQTSFVIALYILFIFQIL